MKTTKLKIEGLHCLSCVDRVEKALEAIPGVKVADVKLEDVTTIEHENVDENKLIQAVAAAGDYKSHIVREDAVYQA
jgi:copper chaperone CopZ